MKVSGSLGRQLVKENSSTQMEILTKVTGTVIKPRVRELILVLLQEGHTPAHGSMTYSTVEVLRFGKTQVFTKESLEKGRSMGVASRYGMMDLYF